jgi:hypothetical protein
MIMQIDAEDISKAVVYDELIMHYAGEIRAFCETYDNKQRSLFNLFSAHILVSVLFIILCTFNSLFIFAALVSVVFAIAFFVALRRSAAEFDWVKPMMRSMIQLHELAKQASVRDGDTGLASANTKMIIDDVELALRIHDATAAPSKHTNPILRLLFRF